MALVKRTQMMTPTASAWKTYLDSLNCSLITVTAASGLLTILVDNLVQINMTIPSAVWFNPITITYNGSTTSEISRLWVGNNVGYNLTTVCSENVFYMQIRDADGRRFGFIYEICGNTKYYGYKGSGNSTGIAWYDISAITLNNTTDGTTCNHGTTLGYSANLGMIDYATNDPLFLSGTKVNTDTNMIACTTVTGDKVYTMSGKNYYAIGAHTLIEMDI